MLGPEAEAALIERARASGAGQEQAVAELFRVYRNPVLALCRSITLHPADAEDALQEVFVAVHRALGRFRGESRLSTWLYRVAIRTALEVKSRRRRAEPLDHALPGREEERQLLARDEARKLPAAIALLPAAHRVVLSLFALDGLTHREIAGILGVPEGTVWSRLNAARRRLAEELGRLGGS